jgi:hypothetical protein
MEELESNEDPGRALMKTAGITNLPDSFNGAALMAEIHAVFVDAAVNGILSGPRATAADVSALRAFATDMRRGKQRLSDILEPRAVLLNGVWNSSLRYLYPGMRRLHGTGDRPQLRAASRLMTPLRMPPSHGNSTG